MRTFWEDLKEEYSGKYSTQTKKTMKYGKCEWTMNWTNRCLSHICKGIETCLTRSSHKNGSEEGNKECTGLVTNWKTKKGKIEQRSINNWRRVSDVKVQWRHIDEEAKTNHGLWCQKKAEKSGRQRKRK